jgi:hypothetical protein
VSAKKDGVSSSVFDWRVLECAGVRRYADGVVAENQISGYSSRVETANGQTAERSR